MRVFQFFSSAPSVPSLWRARIVLILSLVVLALAYGLQSITSARAHTPVAVTLSVSTTTVPLFGSYDAFITLSPNHRVRRYDGNMQFVRTLVEESSILYEYVDEYTWDYAETSPTGVYSGSPSVGATPHTEELYAWFYHDGVTYTSNKVTVSVFNSEKKVEFTDAVRAPKDSYFLGDDDIFVTVTDWGANLSVTATDTVTVTVADPPPPAGSGDSEALTLKETGKNTGVFINEARGGKYGLNNDNFVILNTPGVLVTDTTHTISVNYAGLADTATTKRHTPMWPVKRARQVTQSFGTKEHTFFHTGLDIPALKDEAVFNVQSGNICEISGNYVAVRSVAIRNGQSVFYVYAHVNDLEAVTASTGMPSEPAKVGDRVHFNQKIGEIAGAFTMASGLNIGGTFDHVHFSTFDTTLQIPEAAINPLVYTYANADPGGTRPVFGPWFFEDEASTTLAYFGRPPDLSSTFAAVVYGDVDIAAQITDDMGGWIKRGTDAEGKFKGTIAAPFEMGYSISEMAAKSRAFSVGPLSETSFGVYPGPTRAFVDYSMNRIYQPDKDTTYTYSNPYTLTKGTMSQGYVYTLSNTNAVGLLSDRDSSWVTGKRAKQSWSTPSRESAEAEFPDGWYKVTGFARDLVGTTTAEKWVVVDNFRPYLEKVTVAQGLKVSFGNVEPNIVYEGRWDFDGGTLHGELKHKTLKNDPINVNGGDINITLTFSEPMGDGGGGNHPELRIENTKTGEYTAYDFSFENYTTFRGWFKGADLLKHVNNAQPRQLQVAGQDFARTGLFALESTATTDALTNLKRSLGGFPSAGGTDTVHKLNIVVPVIPKEAGGSIDMPDENGLVIPALSLGRDTSIAAIRDDLPPSPPAGLEFYGDVYDFGPNGTVFDIGNPARLTMRTDKDPTTADIYYYDSADGKWKIVTDGKTVDSANKTISVNITHFTPFAPLGPGPFVPPVPTGHNSLSIAIIGLLSTAMGLIIMKKRVFHGLVEQ